MTRGSLVLVGAYVWAAFVIVTARTLLGGHPPAGYGDLFLFGPALVCMVRSWKPAALLFAISMGIMACFDPPIGVKVFGYSMITLTAAVIIWAVEVARRRTPRK